MPDFYMDYASFQFCCRKWRTGRSLKEHETSIFSFLWKCVATQTRLFQTQANVSDTFRALARRTSVVHQRPIVPRPTHTHVVTTTVVVRTWAAHVVTHRRHCSMAHDRVRRRHIHDEMRCIRCKENWTHCPARQTVRHHVATVPIQDT